MAGGFRSASPTAGYHPPSTNNFSRNSTLKRALAREAGVFEVDSDLRHNRHLNPETPRPRRLRDDHTPVWEEIGATPLVLDFTNVQEALRPERRHPTLAGSKHPERTLYEWAKRRAYEVDPRRGPEATDIRNRWYWDQIDRGKLPDDFNPYVPGSQKHDAFEERVTLVDTRPTAPNGANPNLPVLQTPKQLRARARRKAARGVRLTDEEFEQLCGKPISEWDVEELAKGYPKDKNGDFRRTPPAYMSLELRERVETLFKQRVRGSMNETTVDALGVLRGILANEDVDHRGKPLVAASTKLDAAKFLVEHLLGKPKQTVETDISVKLQGILAGVMVSPEMALPPQPAPGQPALPVGPTGRMLAGQRGYRSDHEDVELRTLRDMGVIDAEIVGDDEE